MVGALAKRHLWTSQPTNATRPVGGRALCFRSAARLVGAAFLYGSSTLWPATSSAAPPAPFAGIDAEVAKLAARYSDGISHNDAKDRHVVYGPLFDTPRPAAVAFFTLAGVGLTNVDREYMAIFAPGAGRDLSKVNGPKERPYHLVATLPVGSRWSRTLDWRSAKISRGQIVVRGRRWSKDDPGCCPSLPIEVTFEVSPDLPDAPVFGQYPVLREVER